MKKLQRVAHVSLKTVFDLKSSGFKKLEIKDCKDLEKLQEKIR